MNNLSLDHLVVFYKCFGLSEKALIKAKVSSSECSP